MMIKNDDYAHKLNILHYKLNKKNCFIEWFDYGLNVANIKGLVL